MALSQREMDTNLDQVLSQQTDMALMLDELENAVNDAYGRMESHMQVRCCSPSRATPARIADAADPSPPPPQPADVDRARTYTMAENLYGQLNQLSESLGDVVERVNAEQTKGEDADDPMHQIVTVLNAHLDSLKWIDAHVARAEEKVHELARKGKERQTELDRLTATRV